MEAARDVVVVGAGPNGLAAAITCARAGLDVLLVEGTARIGGGARSAELTLPGFVHDVCSAIHPLGVASPFFRGVAKELAEHGLAWAHPEIPLAHPLDDGRVALLERSLEDTVRSLRSDGARYRSLFAPFVERAHDLYDDALAPLGVPKNPFLMARFGLSAMLSSASFADNFAQEPARALVAGCGAHSFLPLDAWFTASFSLMLAIAGHAVGWPVARGGSQSIVNAMAAYLRSLGGTIETGRMIASMEELPRAKAYVFDVFPHALSRIAGERLPAGYRTTLDDFRHGPGIFKVDWALSQPVPWRADAARRAGTLHLGGPLEEIAASEAMVARGEHPASPFVLFAQQGIADPSRGHTGWGYCHVPFGSTRDMTSIIEAQVERFAPGFRDCILARHTMSTADYAAYNPNNIGGDITGGAMDLRQLFTRPSIRGYTTPANDIYLCSASTPPGGGVHGMSGWLAAKSALRRVFGR